jgi:Domain of unknown function (DUF4276)
MLCIGLVVEGIYDEAALTEFVRKSVEPDVRVICRPCGNAIQLMKKFPAFLEEFRHAKDGAPVDKGLVIRDADGKNPTELIAKMETRIANRVYSFPRKLLVAVEELEAWLLADEEALSSVTARAVGRVTDPEKIVDPKARLRTILSNAGIVYTAEEARKIAAAARLDTLAVRCPSFKTFQDAVVSKGQ